ncbi:hypothetical protein RUM43_009638 [Polyplax serrata]|uniref:Lysosomal-trafficking regulator n=1 Tax=Polyplax serrata TaxID=468196 RepID=A0AAN8PUL0_POLSC
MTKIQQFWDCFISAESSSYDKSRWFDFFLCQFIVDLNDGYCVEDILTFCNWNGVGTLIGCELLSDVDQVCSQPGDGEDLSPLRHHLFTKGWRALVVLLSLGQQNFSCTNELASLLISLYPICLEGKGNIRRYFGADNKYVHLSTEYELDPCLPSSSLKSKFLDGHAQFTMRADYYRCHTSALSIRNKKLTRGSTSERRNKEINSSESENPNDDANLQNKSCAFKIKLEPVKHDYLKSAVQSEDYNKFDSVHYEPRRKPKLVKKASPMDWMDEKIKDVMQSQVNPYEFSVLVIQLLMSLCKSEHSIGLARDNLYPVCLKSVKFAMENLCSIQFESVSINTLNGAETCNLKYCLTQLFTISFKKIMCCSDVTSNAILTGILPMSLRVLEESVYKLISRINDVGVSSKENNSYESDTENQIIFGLICSTIQFLFNLLIQISEVDRVGNFLELFKTFIESNSGILIEKTIMVLTKFGKITKAKKVIDLIGQLIVKMKNVRQYLIKPHLSKRMKQKKCKNGSEQHHHHDLFGAVYTPVVSSNCQQNCCVSRLFLVLLNLLSNIDEMPVELINHTLKIMIFCGTCCCFTKNNILEYIIAVIKLPYHKSRVLAFQLLEGTLYPELGFYSAAKGKSTCLVCCKQSNSRWTQDNVSNNLSEECFNSGHVSFTDGYCLGQSILNLNLFKELLFSNDIRTVQGVTCHLLKSAPKMTQEGKYIVLFNIFLPVFLSEKMKFFCEKGSLSAFLLLSSLTIFSSLLNNFEFAQGFIRQKGLDVVLDLISVHRFTANCCSVLEKTILVSVLNSDSNVSNIPSVVTLRNAADAANCDFLHYFDAQESVAQIDLGDAKMKQQMTISQRKGIDVVENVFIFWRTYANLVLGNPVLRKYFSGQKFLSDCNKILKTALLSLANKEMKGKVKSMKCQENTESCMFIKLIESLLTFNLAVADYVGSGDSQEKAIIDQLSRNLLVNDLRNMDIRRLSEVLLKCSMIPPNELQINHSDSAPKFLFSPLWTTCGKGDDIEENEERSVSDSESLEDLYVTADEGYDADVEVRDTFSSPGDGFHRNTVSGIDSTAGFQFQGETGFEENSEKCGRVIVYPKLCLAAIDLLIKLYNDKIKENPERNAKSETQNSKFWETQKSNVVKPEIQVHECSIVKDPVHDKLCNFNETDMERKNSKNRLGHDETGEKHGGTENTNMIELISVFQKLTTLCREKSENCAILCNKNVILKLLKGFQSCLSEAKETLTELQKAILDFITILGKYSVTTEELSAYLSLFKGDSPPVDLLFNPLLSWVSSYGSHPTFFLRFPVSIPADFVQNATPDIGKELHIQHRSEGINSCWSLSALSLPIGPDFSWPLWTQGFSISLWIRFDKSCHSGTKQRGHSKQHRKLSKTESGLRDCNLVAVSDVPSIYSKKKSELLSPKPISTQDLLHVFSLGNDGLTLECWTAPDLEVLVWRLSRIVNHGEYEIIAEKAVQHCFSVSSWTHLAINVRNVVTRKTTLIQVTFVSNGGNEISICLALSSAPVRRSRTSSLLLGAQGTIHKKGSFFFGSLMLFTNPVFTRERAVYLLGFGPKCTSLIDCLIGRRRPNFTSIFSNKILINEIDWEKILDAKLELIRDAQNHLLMIYSAENPHTFNIYPSCSGINSAPFCSGLRSVSPETSAAQLGPICLIPSLFASLDIHKYQGLIHTAYILGGSSTFMFLFARCNKVMNVIVEFSLLPH